MQKNNNIIKILEELKNDFESLKSETDISRYLFSEDSEKQEILDNAIAVYDEKIGEITGWIEQEKSQVGIGITEASKNVTDIKEISGALAKDFSDIKELENLKAYTNDIFENTQKNSESLEHTLYMRTRDYLELGEDSKIENPNEIESKTVERKYVLVHDKSDLYFLLGEKTQIEKQDGELEENHLNALIRTAEFNGIEYEVSDKPKEGMYSIEVWVEKEIQDEKDAFEKDQEAKERYERDDYRGIEQIED